MKRISFNKFFAWHLRRQADRLGVAGVVGLGLLAFCAMFYFSAVVPSGREAQALKREEGALQAQRKPSYEQLRQQPAGQLAAFYESFPRESALPDVLERLYQSAAGQDVVLERGEYQLVRDGADKLIRYHIALPIKADYTHIRNFLARLLADVPYISLDSVAFERQKVSDATLDAQLKLTLFMRGN